MSKGVKFCPICKSGRFIIYEQYDEMFVTCDSFGCKFKMQIWIVPETEKKGEE